MKEENPLVSVVVITYNQESTITQTLDSILAQKVDFPIEIIIGEDCSTDKTREICLRYAAKHPNIKLVLHDVNQGLLKNYQSVISECSGKYIAQCAGDDWWHNPDKLKIQVDFLEIHPDSELVHTNAYALYVEENKLQKMRRGNIPTGNVFNNLLMYGNHIMAVTVMFRKRLLQYVDLDEYIDFGLKTEDLPMWLEFSRYTKFSFLNDFTCTYRVCTNSVSNFNNYEKTKEFMENMIRIREYFYEKYNNFIDHDDFKFKLNIDRFYLALKYKKTEDVLKYSKFLPENTIRDKIKKTLFSKRFFIKRYINIKNNGINNYSML